MIRFPHALILVTIIFGGCASDDNHENTNNKADTGVDAGTDTAEEVLDLRSLQPAQGSFLGGTTVTLSGRGFQSGMTVAFGDMPGTSVVVLTSRQATVVSPSTTMPGAVDVVVTNPDSTASTLPGVFTFVEGIDPQIGYCQLQAQSPATAVTGEDSERLYAFVYAEGLTPVEGQGSGITGELGWGISGAAVQNFNWSAATYNVDLDGASPGDKANDEYGARLKSSTAGLYDYLARFKTSNGDWVYCDLDGSTNGADDRGVFEVVDPVLPTVGFCSTQTAQVSNLSGQPSTAIRGAVFIAGLTNGAGAGAGILSELRYGATGTAPSTWTSVVTGAYAEDADGLNSGDLANDIYTGVISAQTQGDYAFAYRFSADGGGTWTWCDTSGSPPFDATEVGRLETRDVIVNLPDSCRLQFPALVTTTVVGQPVTVFGRITEGVITGTGSQAAGLKAELLIGLATEDPATTPGSFMATPATLRTTGVINPGPNEDEYEANFVGTSAGEYAFTYRFSVDNGQHWSYCDLDSTMSAGTYSRDKIGYARVFEAASAPDLLDFCNIWQSTLSASIADDSPLVTIETFEPGLTDVAFTGTEIEAQLGYGPWATNPALPGAFTWNPAFMPYKGPRASAPNNQEYEGRVYGNTAKPPVGAYGVAVRVRRSGTNSWAYCDTNNTTMNFFVDQATSLTITP